jgi:hypothetical protein
MWFGDGEKLHQRGYTLVDLNPEADTVDSNFTLPEPAPKGYVTSATPHRCPQSTRCSPRSATSRPGCSWRRGTTTTSNCRWRAARLWCG